MHQTTSTSKNLTSTKPVKAILALTPVNAETYLKISLERKLGTETTPGIQKAPLKWKKTKQEILDFMRKLGNKRVVVISNEESVEDIAHKYGASTNIHTMTIIRILGKDAKSKKLGFNRSFGGIVEEANNKFGLDVLDKKLTPVFEDRWASIERGLSIFQTAEKTTSILNKDTAQPINAVMIGCGEKSGLLTLIAMDQSFDLVLHIQKEKGVAETGFERKIVAFGPGTEDRILSTLQEINKEGEPWQRSGNTICSHVGEPVGHFSGNAKPVFAGKIWKIITSVIEKKSMTGKEMPPRDTNHNGFLQTGCLDGSPKEMAAAVA